MNCYNLGFSKQCVTQRVVKTLKDSESTIQMRARGLWYDYRYYAILMIVMTLVFVFTFFAIFSWTPSLLVDSSQGIGLVALTTAVWIFIVSLNVTKADILDKQYHLLKNLNRELSKIEKNQKDMQDLLMLNPDGIPQWFIHKLDFHFYQVSLNLQINGKSIDSLLNELFELSRHIDIINFQINYVLTNLEQQNIGHGITGTAYAIIKRQLNSNTTELCTKVGKAKEELIKLVPDV